MLDCVHCSPVRCLCHPPRHHSWYAATVRDGWLDRLREVLRRFPGAGIGEAGLHFAPVPAQFARQSCCADGAAAATGTGADREAQLAVCKAQLALAVELRRPVSLHCVGKGSGEALRRLLAEVGPFTPPACVVMHSYSLGPGLVQPLQRAGGGHVYFSFGGSVVNPKARRVREAVLRVPLDRLLVETDAPDQMPAHYVHRATAAAASCGTQWLLARSCERVAAGCAHAHPLPTHPPVVHDAAGDVGGAGGGRPYPDAPSNAVPGGAAESGTQVSLDATCVAGATATTARGVCDTRWCRCCGDDRAARQRVGVNEPSNVAAFVAQVADLRRGLDASCVAVACAAYGNALRVFDFARGAEVMSHAAPGAT